jgi:hypothetical protein
MERAKWRVWNGQSPRALADLGIWGPGRRHGEVPAVVMAFCRRLTELIAYLDANADSLPNYGTAGGGAPRSRPRLSSAR